MRREKLCFLTLVEFYLCCDGLKSFFKELVALDISQIVYRPVFQTSVSVQVARGLDKMQEVWGEA